MQHVTTTPPVRLPIGSSVLDGEAPGQAPVARRPAIRHGASWEAEESYRKAALFLSKMVAAGDRSVLFCSARRGEGTTTAVLSLAHQLQDSYGLRALVVELNRRSPALAKLFSLDPALTLDDALDRSKPAAECIQVTPSGLSIIAGGSRRAASPHPRLASGLQRVLSEVESQFDVVLLDAPPIFTQAEAIIAATVVPTLILIVESGRTSYEVLARVKRELATEDIKIAGTVLVKQKRVIPRWLHWVDHALRGAAVRGPMPAIAVEDVSKGYREWRLLRRRHEARAEAWALRHVSFRVDEGETVALLGPNGAGKTTLLKIIATLLYVSSGRVLIHGRDVIDDPIRARRLIGLVTSDERSFYWRLTGRQNLTFFAALYGLAHRSIADRVATLLDATALTEAGDRPFHTYSSGMKQRLAIARGFLSDPRIVLYDEPTRSLDPLTAQHIRKWIAASRALSPQTTHLIATNQLGEAEALCGRALIINRGAAIATGTFEEIRQRWRQHDYAVHRITYRGPGLDRGWEPLPGSGLVEIREEHRDAATRTLRVSAVEDSDALSLTLSAILAAGGVVLRCETEQVPFDEVFCGLLDRAASAAGEGALAEVG